MTIGMLLYVSLIIYIIIMGLAVLFKIKWLFMIAGLVWFVPITQLDNPFLILVSVIIMVIHFMLGFLEKSEGEF